MRTISARVRQVAPAALLAASVAIGLGHPAVAGAEPTNPHPAPGREWDIGHYDECIFVNGDVRAPTCCALSGGEWNAKEGKCEAPAPLGAGPQAPGDSPPVADPGGPIPSRPGVANPLPTALAPNP
ncbi:hypothetical protein ABGB19_07290 [Mycobacterium sp. B14F4]|uniref:hypothetical protein n=1 Tax=Mycobacterium sp. B14F4 TaxID=3153565 RepID=UPI00325F1827